MTTAALAAIAASALAPAPAAARMNARASRAMRAEQPCSFKPSTPFSIGDDLLGNPAYQVGAALMCQANRWNDVRLCPQQLVDGTWQFIPGSGGWVAGTGGTCHDAAWTFTTGTAMTWQFNCTPGQDYRTWAREWMHGSTATVTSPAFRC